MFIQWLFHSHHQLHFHLFLRATQYTLSPRTGVGDVVKGDDVGVLLGYVDHVAAEGRVLGAYGIVQVAVPEQTPQVHPRRVALREPAHAYIHTCMTHTQTILYARKYRYNCYTHNIRTYIQGS